MIKCETDQVGVKGVIVLVHGSGEHHGRYDWLISQFLNQGYHVVTGDLPGHGKKTLTPGHINSFNEYLDEITLWTTEAETYDDLPVFIFGHSLGGLAVVRWLQEHPKTPAEGVILSSPCLGLAFKVPKPLRWLGAFLNRVKPNQLIGTKKSGGNPNATRNKEILERDHQDPYIVKKVSARWFYELEANMLVATHKTADFPNIPLCIMQAGNDLVVSKQIVRAWYEKINIDYKHYKEWDGLYHEVTNEPEREEVVAEMIQFLETIHSRRMPK